MRNLISMKYFAFVFIILTSLAACSKKTTPSKDTAAATEVNKPVYKAPVKTPTPKAIVVNDAAAKKSADGRRYYDLEGKRYWRNNRDGKYYLYYKGMFDNKDFQ